MKEYLSQIHPVADDLLEAYLSHWKSYSVPKRTLLTREGETERYMYFVKERIQKSYYLQGAKQHVIAFTYPPSFSGIPESFLMQTPARYYLETITDSEFLRISYEQHQAMIAKYRPIETLFRKGTEQLLADTLTRYHELMAFDMETRFINFFRRSPHLLQMVSQRDLASYLNMDSTNFSKLLGQHRI
ncbi:cyclic nucleotide-binding domain-containing protein [Pontibacter sp. G13]|uniref:Crp/Fnr family transcriptional regulator n=1 Tax=Pontibacter sp. G13 TaxID=3074898 RepID=UPI00288BE8BB|nr:cyclic nucleotide-binding domain-containing protein [Pontibacter sp. G13]WNJ17039.1 Crp/Fnr family transcriptional regulator [Pontibacter sp. G13]